MNSDDNEITFLKKTTLPTTTHNIKHKKQHHSMLYSFGSDSQDNNTSTNVQFSLENSLSDTTIHKEINIIPVLVNFDGVNTQPAYKHFQERTFITNDNDVIYDETEIKIIKRIEKRIHLFYNMRSPNNWNPQSDYSIDKEIEVLHKTKKDVELLFLKTFVISTINYLIELIRNTTDLDPKSTNYTNDFDIETFQEIYDDYNTMMVMCPKIEEEFPYCLEEFKNIIINSRKCGQLCFFTLTELFRDIFWDFMFKIKVINQRFVDVFNNEKEYNDLDKITQIDMRKIIDELWDIKKPLLKYLCEELKIENAVNNDGLYLSMFISEMKERKKEASKEINDLSFKERKQFEIVSMQNIIITKDEGTDMCSNNSNNNEEENKSKKVNDECKDEVNKKKEFESFDDFVAYIESNDNGDKGGNNTGKKKGKKKSKKKAKKNKNASDNVNNNTSDNVNKVESTIVEKDEIVDNFKRILNKCARNAYEIYKPKARISDKWIEFVMRNN